MIPDIEAWAVFLGITRQTLWTYEKRGSEWRDVIEYYKGVIQATKKQLALNYKVPPAVFIFDSVNNHNYLNVSEYKMTQLTPAAETENNIDEQIKQAGLVWNEEQGTFEPLEG